MGNVMLRNRLLVALFAFVCASCSQTPKQPDHVPGDGPAQATLSSAVRERLHRLYDRVSIADEALAQAAAHEISALGAAEMAYVETLWGPRIQTIQLAQRIANAFFPYGGSQVDWHQLEEASAAAFAEKWLKRALNLRGTPTYYEGLSLRYDLARCLVALGRPGEALDLLVNRPDPRPVPDALSGRYAELINKLISN